MDEAAGDSPVAVEASPDRDQLPVGAVTVTPDVPVAAAAVADTGAGDEDPSEVERFFGDGVEVDASNEATPTAESPRVAAAADGGAKPTEAAGSDPAAATPSQATEAAAATGGAEDGADAQAATAPVPQAKKECFLKYTHADYGQSKCADRDHRKNVLYQIALADFKEVLPTGITEDQWGCYRHRSIFYSRRKRGSRLVLLTDGDGGNEAAAAAAGRSDDSAFKMSKRRRKAGRARNSKDSAGGSGSRRVRRGGGGIGRKRIAGSASGDSSGAMKATVRRPRKRPRRSAELTEAGAFYYQMDRDKLVTLLLARDVEYRDMTLELSECHKYIDQLARSHRQLMEENGDLRFRLRTWRERHVSYAGIDLGYLEELISSSSDEDESDTDYVERAGFRRPSHGFIQPTPSRAFFGTPGGLAIVVRPERLQSSDDSQASPSAAAAAAAAPSAAVTTDVAMTDASPLEASAGNAEP